MPTNQPLNRLAQRVNHLTGHCCSVHCDGCTQCAHGRHHCDVPRPGHVHCGPVCTECHNAGLYGTGLTRLLGDVNLCILCMDERYGVRVNAYLRTGDKILGEVYRSVATAIVDARWRQEYARDNHEPIPPYSVIVGGYAVAEVPA